jgi:hypothetical protein
MLLRDLFVTGLLAPAVKMRKKILHVGCFERVAVVRRAVDEPLECRFQHYQDGYRLDSLAENCVSPQIRFLASSPASTFTGRPLTIVSIRRH